MATEARYRVVTVSTDQQPGQGIATEPRLPGEPLRTLAAAVAEAGYWHDQQSTAAAERGGLSVQTLVLEDGGRGPAVVVWSATWLRERPVEVPAAALADAA